MWGEDDRLVATGLYADGLKASSRSSVAAASS